MAKEKADYSLHFTRVNKINENSEMSMSDWYNGNQAELYFELNKHLNKSKNKSILDLGCGIGNILYYLKQAGFTNYLGVDSSSEQLNICRRYVTNNVIENDIFAFLRNTDKHFDSIILFDLIEHINKENIHELLELISIVLNDNGEILIRTPNMSSFVGVHMRYDDFTHEVGFTKESLQQILEKSNFHEMRFTNSFMKRKKKIVAKMLYWIIYKILFGYKPEITTPNIIASAKKKK